MTFTPLKHIVFVPGPSWGHLRPGLKTSLRMVEKFQDIFISLFVYHTEVSKAEKYLNAQTAVSSNRIRIVTTSNSEVLPMEADNAVEMLRSMEQSLNLWINNEFQQATIIQIEGRPVNTPSLIIEDLFNGGMSLASQSIHNIPIVAWWLMTAASLMTLTGYEGFADGVGIFERLALLRAQGGEDFFTKASEAYVQEISDRLICIPGLPAYHEWELNTQYLPFIPPFVAFMVPRMKNMLKHVDTLVCCTTFEVEPVSATSLSSAFNKSITPFFIGPSVDLASPYQPDPESPVTQFLNRAYTEKGAHSVIYVAFGTAFFPLPSSMSHLTAALDEIPKAGFRFIFALSSARAQVDKSWMDAHIRAGNAIFPEWTNQTAVLEHPAIHYFLSHGGWNSSTEALVRGVPMIFWPFIGDQPTNSMQIATVNDCGFELLQVRTGPAKSRAYRSGSEVEIVGTDDAVREEMRSILEASKGPRGRHQRTNTRVLGKVIADSLAPSGSGETGLEKFGVALELSR
ncbi:hypothetical protein OPQ81_001074 [Rhizoctonia solani]|nr:hypothetical protein OPQ81_001074 [Rhizoctonia solani]